MSAYNITWVEILYIVLINIIGMGLLKSIQDLCIFLSLEEVSHTYSGNSISYRFICFTHRKFFARMTEKHCTLFSQLICGLFVCHFTSLWTKLLQLKEVFLTVLKMMDCTELDLTCFYRPALWRWKAVLLNCTAVNLN